MIVDFWDTTVGTGHDRTLAMYQERTRKVDSVPPCSVDPKFVPLLYRLERTVLIDTP